ncbi:MAG TPA: hypothetical protein VGH87_02675 [Polyangiaceae bacterium]
MTLTKIERGWARVVLTTMFPAGVHPSVPGAEVIDGGEALDDVVRTVPSRVALGLRAALLLLVLAPLAFFEFRTLPGLAPEARERVVLALLSSRIYVVRQLTLLLKAFGALMFVAAPGVREKIVGRGSLVKLEVRHVA